MSLLLRLRDGRDDDWRTFYSIYGPMVFQLANRRHRLDLVSTEEIVAAVMEKLMGMFRQGWRVDHDKGRFRSVLAELTARAVADRARRRKREQRGALPAEIDVEPVDAGPAPADELARIERIARLQLCLDRLHEDPTVRRRDWTAFQRYALHEEPAARVAKDLEITVGRLYAIKCQTLKRMKKLLAKLDLELGEV